MDLRLNCLVPGCRRTRGQHKGERPVRADEVWVCGEHWRLVPRKMKAVLTRTRRKARRTGNYVPSHRIWWRCAHVAIERSVGL